MTGLPPVPPGQLSPDGLWRWDGTQWVPATPPGSLAPPPRRSQAWIGWLVGGCSLLLVIALVAIGFGSYSLIHNLQNTVRNGAFSCLPPDFPRYPAATVVGFKTDFGHSSKPGDTLTCHVTLDSNDDVTTVAGFYALQLNNGTWTLTSNDLGTGLITFQLNRRPATVGQVQVFGGGQHSEIQIQLDS